MKFPNLIKFIRYSVVGAVASLVDITVFCVFANIMHANYILANVFAFIAGSVTNYYFSTRWVFGRPQFNYYLGFILCTLIGFIGLIFSSFIMYILIDQKLILYLSPDMGMGLMKFAAKIIATIIVFFWNYGARRLFIYRREEN